MDKEMNIDNNFDIVIEEKFIPIDPPPDDNDNHQEGQNVSKSIYKFKCKCFKIFAFEGIYLSHVKICPIVNKNSIMCRNFRCYEKFANQNDFENHIRNGDCQRKRKLKNEFHCYYDNCDAKFTTSGKLKFHRISVHVPNSYICLYCDMTFKVPFHKLDHEKTHQKIQVSKFSKTLKKVKKSSKSSKNVQNSSSKSKNVELKKPSASLKPFLFEQIPQIKQEIDLHSENPGSDLPRRVTRSQSKQNYSKFFDSDEEKVEENSSKSVENDGDTSTTASLSSFLDSSDDNEEIPSKNTKNSNHNLNYGTEYYVKPSEYLCYKCREGFVTKLDVRHHEKNCLINVQKVPLAIKCEFEGCTKIFSNVKLYNRHLDKDHYDYYLYKDKTNRLASKKIKVKKEEADETLCKNDNLRIKKKDGNGNNGWYRKCRTCHVYFRMKNDLKEHEMIEHSIQCTKCPMVFVQECHLDRHVRFKHFEVEDIKKQECSICFKRFNDLHYLRNHIAKVHRRKIKVCPFCTDELSYDKFARHLTRHKMDGRGKVFCKICQIFLTSYSKMEKHNLTEIHLKKMTIKSEVKVEIKTEETETPSEEFILPDDDEEANEIDTYLIQSNNMFRRTVNEGIVNDINELSKNAKKRITTCQDCGLKFKSTFFRQRHQIKYHGYKKDIFYCDLCDATFAQKCTLDVHIKKSRAHKLKMGNKGL